MRISLRFSSCEQAWMWCSIMGSPPIGNSGLGMSKDNGRKRVPENDDSLIADFSSLPDHQAKYSYENFNFLAIYSPFLSPPTKITAFNIFSVTQTSYNWLNISQFSQKFFYIFIVYLAAVRFIITSWATSQPTFTISTFPSRRQKSRLFALSTSFFSIRLFI